MAVSREALERMREASSGINRAVEDMCRHPEMSAQEIADAYRPHFDRLRQSMLQVAREVRS